MTPVTVASEPVLPGPVRLPDPAPTTTAVPVTPPEYHANAYESLPSSVVGRTVTSVEAAVRPTTTSTVSTTATVARLNPPTVTGCGPYPYTPCIPLVGNRATWSCIIQHESGGNPAAVEPHSGAGGIFQFLGTTWRGLGYPGVAQTASIATQILAAAKLYLQSGFTPWHGDGCV